ncbi:MAG: hypothetical protein J0M04_24760 [Verrucomicrobia bacterium]|nr:hypothetical protein [Verrucomicrobiota bacterium]
MSFEGELFLREEFLPVQSESDAGGVLKEPDRLLLSGEFGELAIERMIGRDEGFLAMQDRRIGTGSVIVAAGLAGHKINDDRLRQGRMRVGLEIRIGKKRDFRRCGVELQQVECGSDIEPFPEFRHGDPERRGNARIVAWIEQIDRARKTLAIGKRFDGLAVFGGGHESGGSGSGPVCQRYGRAWCGRRATQARVRLRGRIPGRCPGLLRFTPLG